MNREEAKNICNQFLSGNYTDKEMAAILNDLAEKGETPNEIAGFSNSLLTHVAPFPNRDEVFDLCGTGGSNVERFNVSTSVAFILSSLDIKVAKHGNRGSKKPNGSFDLLEKLGINIELDGEMLGELLDETNLAFIYARKFHTAMKNVANARKIVNRRTIFNLAGPISNPANVVKQVIGTTDIKSTEIMFDVQNLLDRKRSLVITGYPNIDELSISGESIYYDSIDSTIDIHKIIPEDFATTRIEYEQIPTGNADDNAKEFIKLIEGNGDKGIESMVCANAGIALLCNGNTGSIQEGIALSKEIIQSGKMKEKFYEYQNKADRFNTTR